MAAYVFPFPIQKKEIPDLSPGLDLPIWYSLSSKEAALNRSGDLTGAHTPGTNIHMAGGTVDDRLHPLHVGLPRTIGTPVRVGNLDAEGHALVAELALCHPLHLPAVV